MFPDPVEQQPKYRAVEQHKNHLQIEYRRNDSEHGVRKKNEIKSLEGRQQSAGYRIEKLKGRKQNDDRQVDSHY